GIARHPRENAEEKKTPHDLTIEAGERLGQAVPCTWRNRVVPAPGRGRGHDPLMESPARRRGRVTGRGPLRRCPFRCMAYLAAAVAPTVGHLPAQYPNHELMRTLVRTLSGQQGPWLMVEVAAPSA